MKKFLLLYKVLNKKILNDFLGGFAVIINGKDYKISECSTISDILEKLNINKEKVVVEVNLNIISKDEYDSFIVKENDSLEVLSFVGGG